MQTHPVSIEVKEQNPSSTPEELLIIDAKARFKEAQDHWGEFTKEAEDCLTYLETDAYLDDRYKAARDAAGLPTLTENHIRPVVEHNVNEFKQSIPAIQISAANNETSPEFAEQLADLFRTIEYDSNAKEQYATAGWYCISTGLGFVRVKNEFESDDSMKQKLSIHAIEDPSTVFMDPTHKSPTGSDCNYIFVITALTHDEYLRRYKNSELAKEMSNAKVSGWTDYTTRMTGTWFTPSVVLVAEYWVREYTTFKLYQYFDTEIGASKTTTDLAKVGSHKVEDTRDVETYTIKQYIINDKEILDENEYPGIYIPIVAFKGMEFWNKGKRHLSGIIQNMRGPQKRVDYAINWQNEMLMLMPKAPYVGTVKNFEDNSTEWGDLNHSNQAYVTYTPDPANNGVKPERDVLGFDINASQTILANAVEGIRATTGMQAPMTGELASQMGPESGKAILTRVQQSQMTRFTEQFAIRNSIAQVGNVLMQGLPFYKENGRQVIGTKQNGTQYMISLNDASHNMLEGKKFKVAIETGPTYATKMQEASDRGLTAMEALPSQAPNFADLVFDNMSFPGSKQIAARLRATVPPNVLAATEDVNEHEGPQQIANLKSQVASLSQQLQQVTQEAEPDKIKIQQLTMEKSMVEHDNSWEFEKTKLEHDTDMKKLELEEKKIILQAEIKRAELDLQKRELEMRERELGIKATVAKSDIGHKTMDRHTKVMESLNNNGVDNSQLDDLKREVKGGLDSATDDNLSGALE